MNSARLFLKVLAITIIAWPVSSIVAAETDGWTLESAVQRVLEVAPERRAAEAEVAARAGALKQAGAWPNPSIELRADEKLGIEEGRGGSDLTQATISQPLPLRRLARERRQAEAQLSSAHERLRHVRLMREVEAARAFHTLQLAQARLKLAEQRIAFVEKLDSGTARRGGGVVRYLTPLERARLAILRETAEQEATSAEGKYSEAVAQFRALLALAPETVPQTVLLAPTVAPTPLVTLLDRLESHAALAAHDQDIEAARAGIDVARASRFADPTLGVFRERDFIGGQRREFGGVTLSVQVPLWNLNSGGVARAVAEADLARERRVVLRRDLEARLRQGHLHINHLIGQAARYRDRLLTPARQLLALAQRGFEAGESNVLALVDAYNTYFDAELRYHELLHEGWQEAAELRLAAGVALTQPETAP